MVEFIFLLPDGGGSKAEARSVDQAIHEWRQATRTQRSIRKVQILQITRRSACEPSMDDAAIVLRAAGERRLAGVAA